jgi:AraC-like DNA-binding protein
MLDERDETHLAMVRLIASEISRRDIAPLKLPAPASAATENAANLLNNGKGRTNVATVACQVGLSTRALERRFVSETGMTPGSWARAARFHDALRQLAAGQSVKAAAQIAGYRTPSAFVAAFRQAFGTTPARYFGPTEDASGNQESVRSYG